jgi:hypothetical protein
VVVADTFATAAAVAANTHVCSKLPPPPLLVKNLNLNSPLFFSFDLSDDDCADQRQLTRNL